MVVTLQHFVLKTPEGSEPDMVEPDSDDGYRLQKLTRYCGI